MEAILEKPYILSRLILYRNLFLREKWICRVLQLMTQYNHAFKKWCIHHQKMEQIPYWQLYQLKIIKQVLKQFWKKSSSPSGSNLGHYRAALTSDSICFVYATLISIPFDCGFTLDRWTNALLVMLEKNKGTPSLNKPKSKQTKGYTAHGSRFEYGSPDRLWEKAEDENVNEIYCIFKLSNICSWDQINGLIYI